CGPVYGELLTFDDPETRLPTIDRLEGFRPGGPSLYRRVLVPVYIVGQKLLAWLYVGPSDRSGCRFLSSGRSPSCPPSESEAKNPLAFCLANDITYVIMFEHG
ncbi:MAG TPA: gamma-glutamylcyclotransferase, partial [Phycisphaerales bacterium]|nr:gamma-glutamylcyclotransferase [Phycisphaerales bacterium]